jgi:diguanylate cyclase (GGDEF)-like protein/PAS domain S-box-containing protein
MRAAQSLTLPAFEATVAATPDQVRSLEAALVSARAAEERFRALIEAIRAISYITDWDEFGTIRYISSHVEEALGYPPERWYAAPDHWTTILHPEDKDRVLAESSRAFAAGVDFTAEYRVLAADGRVVWIAERETIVRDELGRPSFCHGVMFDVTLLKTTEERLVAAEAALREERDLAQRYLDVARTLLLVLDADGSVRLLNQYGHELAGYPAGSLIGCDWFGTVLPPETRAIVRESFAAAMETTAETEHDDGVSEWELVTSTGERRTIAWRHTLLRDRDGHATGALASGEDITDRLHAEAQIRRLAYSDPLTGLANRSHFDGELHAAVGAGRPVGLLFVDLDDFKLVNDTLGHGVGDELLRAVGGRLARIPGAGVVGRHGGDEFLVLLPELPEDAPAAAREAAAVATRRLAEPFGIAGHQVRIRASVGSAVFPHEATDADALLRAADDDMYRVKRRSRASETGR